MSDRHLPLKPFRLGDRIINRSDGKKGTIADDGEWQPYHVTFIYKVAWDLPYTEQPGLSVSRWSHQCLSHLPILDLLAEV